MTRFELLVVVRIQLGDRALLRRCLAVEAAMEGLAEAVRAAGREAPREAWALLGLGAGIDLKLTAENPLAAGVVAAELLEAEGFSRPHADQVRAARRDPIDALGDDACALAAAWGLAPAVLAAADARGGLDAVDAEAVRAALGTPDGERAERALAALELDEDAAIVAVCARMIAVREDLAR